MTWNFSSRRKFKVFSLISYIWTSWTRILKSFLIWIKIILKFLLLSLGIQSFNKLLRATENVVFSFKYILYLLGLVNWTLFQIIWIFLILTSKLLCNCYRVFKIRHILVVFSQLRLTTFKFHFVLLCFFVLSPK